MRYLMFFLLLAHSFCVNAQKIDKNETDEFTQSKIRTTTWQKLTPQWDMFSHSRVGIIDGKRFLEIQIALPHVFGVPDGDVLYFKMEDDTILKLNNLKHEISCRGCGTPTGERASMQGVSLRFLLFDEDFQQLITKDIIKMRLVTTNGYIESEVKERKRETIKNALQLIESTHQN